MRPLSHRDLCHHPRSRHRRAEHRDLSRPPQVADPARPDDTRNVARRRLLHWQKYRARGEPMPVAIVVGCPPAVAYQGPQRLPRGHRRDHGRRRPRRRADQCRARPHRGPHGPGRIGDRDRRLVDPDYLEPEGPFGKSHGYVALEEYNLVVEVTAITHAAMPSSFDHQPGHAERIERRQAPRLRAAVPLASARHARHQGIRRVVLHEPLTNLRKLVILQFADRHAALGNLARPQRRR